MRINSVKSENIRIKAEYDRREAEIDPDLYAPWQPGEILITSERKRVAALMMKEGEMFPKLGDRCLEIGYGKLGWLADLISWGIRETDLYGVELDEKRARVAQEALPSASLTIGDATKMRWEDNYFHYVIVSTVLSSVIDPKVRGLLALEAARVVRSGGAIIVYDLRVDNPRNSNVTGIKRSQIKEIFPDFTCYFRSVTLVPPIARFVAKRSWPLAILLSNLPFLRTHFIALLVKP